MKINDTRKSPIQTTLGGRELTAGKTYQMVDGDGYGYAGVGDIVLATSLSTDGGGAIIVVNLSANNAATMRGVLGNSMRFVPVNAEVVVK